jgi:acetoin:2,6-dichlorophenolindophenol oxidoreductase subunit alpha
MPPALALETRQEMLRRMLEIRIAEEEIQKLFLQNLIRGTTHLCIGQEACSVGVAWAMEPGDTMTCTYRGHGHALALGMQMRALMAEMMGKQSGCCKGKGGSMHMTAAEVGLLGANAIVGAQLPIAVGAALTYQVKGLPHAAITFFGEGATNIGAFHEALNMAAIWKLPVIFCCENNRYGEYSAQHKTTPVADIATRAIAYNMPGLVVDGQDVETVHAEMKAALERARAGEGPTLLEFKTYRYRGHSRTDTAPYRAKGELEEWLKRDPIDLLKARMIADGQLDETEFDELKGAAETLVFESIEFAKSEPYPPLEELLTDIYYEK